MRRRIVFSTVVLSVLALLLVSCSGPSEPSDDSADSGNGQPTPNLPASTGINPFVGKIFILYDRDNDADEKVVFTEGGFTVWELDDNDWVPGVKGVYSFDAPASQLFGCVTDTYDEETGWLTTSEYVDRVIESDFRNQRAAALSCGLAVDADPSDIRLAFLSMVCEPSTWAYTLGSEVTVANVRGYRLKVEGVYEPTIPWHRQRNGGFVGESNSDELSDIKEGSIRRGGSIKYYTGSIYYFVTSVTDSTMFFMDVYENETSHAYTVTGSGRNALVTLHGTVGDLVLEWEASDDLN